MSIVERERQAEEVLTEREQRARVLEAAALEVEVRGWMRNMVCGFDGRVCAGGAILFAAGFTPEPGAITLGAFPGGWEAIDSAFGPDPYTDIQNFNDVRAKSAGEVTFLLRWRAEEIRDGR